MMLSVTKEKKINSLKDIREKKLQLMQKADVKALKIRNRLDNLVNNTSPQLVFDEVLEKFELQNTVINYLPILLKYRHLLSNVGFIQKLKNAPAKKTLIIAAGAIITGLITYFYLNNKKKPENGN